MKNNLPLFTFVILTILFASCSRKTDPDLNEEVKNQISQKFLVSRGEALLLTSGTAKNARPGESTDREIEEIADFVDKFGRIVFYAMNFKNESGFLLLSADKRLKPILAFSDKGAFNMNSENPGLQLWKDMIAEHFANVQQKDTAHINVVNQWRRFEAGLDRPNVRTNDQPIYTPEASCEYFVTHPIPPNVTIQHLTANVAFWEQGKGYNANCPNGIVTKNCGAAAFECGKAPVGCGPLAIGEVLKYYHPAITVNGHSYSSADIQNMPTSRPFVCNSNNVNEVRLSQFLRDIGQEVNATYNTVVPALGIPMSGSGCQTWSTPGKTDDFFSAHGFTSFDLDFFNMANQETIRSELLASRPVIVFGSSCSVCLAAQHIWVIDGIQDLYAIFQDQQGFCYSHHNVVFQMNWGWADASENNGWFSYTDITGDGTLYNSSNMKAYIARP
jgi:hypothetical protein